MKTTLTRINQISHIALAIKTVPSLALHDYALRVQDDINRQLAQARTNNPGLTYEEFASLAYLDIPQRAISRASKSRRAA